MVWRCVKVDVGLGVQENRKIAEEGGTWLILDKCDTCDAK
jgi:hypothetical protein